MSGEDNINILATILKLNVVYINCVENFPWDIKKTHTTHCNLYSDNRGVAMAFKMFRMDTCTPKHTTPTFPYALYGLKHGDI